MDILSDQCDQSFSIKGGKVGSDQLYQFVKLIDVSSVPFCDIIFLEVLEVALSNGRPHDAINYQNDLAWEHFDPLRPFNTFFGKLQNALSDDAFECVFHGLLAVSKPLLDLSSKNAISQMYFFSFHADHGGGDSFIIEPDVNKIFEHFSKVRFYLFKGFHGRQNLKKFVVGEKVETLEEISLFLKEVLQGLLDGFKSFIVGSKYFKSVVSEMFVCVFFNINRVFGLFHHDLPFDVDLAEHGRLFWKIFHCEWRFKDRLQINPILLVKVPLVHQILDVAQHLALQIDSRPDGSNILGGENVIDHHDIVIDFGDKLIVIAKYISFFSVPERNGSNGK